ncbi:alpha/beta fold hydrolase [Streptomyces sp. NBC_01465]|uniref:alpha/beta fold hydrolase n=1 Tax=Streptomyces sp. NBC_01465 TaxID=2903878 RepID=UPI002E34FCB4|nr:alpha/beta hydrolase [Streptomyces sp. NBC_01465]
MNDTAVTTDDGAGLWAVQDGEGPPVILCHGGPGLWDTLDDVAQLLPGHTVFRWDQRGCGRSAPSAGPYTLAGAVADLDAVRRHFGLEQVVLLGHSWGAQLALAYALEHPDRVSRIVYVSGMGIDPVTSWHPQYSKAFRKALGKNLDRWQEATGRERAVLQWSVEFQDRSRAMDLAEQMATPWFPINQAANTALNTENKRSWGRPLLRNRCEVLKVPVLIVDGAKDIRARRVVDSLEEALPDVRRVTLRGAGHLPWTEDPDGFRTAVADFL